MDKHPATGVRGLKGWEAGYDDLIAYRDALFHEWEVLQQLWGTERPPVTRKVAFQPPTGGPVAILTPSPQFMMMLRRGGVIRHMRVIDETARGTPVFEGTGEVMGSMTEEEAFDFLIWKDVPRGTNQVAVIDASSVPTDRSRRASWELCETGIAA